MAKRRSHLMRILYDNSIARKVLEANVGDSGIADSDYFPFLAIVGQNEMKLALLLSLVNRNVGGVLLIGPRGTGKTTAVRGLTDLMPVRQRSLCPYGCEEEMAFQDGVGAVCEDCAQKIAYGEAITAEEKMRLTELPLNARLEDVVGGINERMAIEQNKIMLNRGILSYADLNLLYIDEVNLLEDDIINAILDAAAQGRFTVRRGPMAATYRSRLFLVGSMNPEEGRLRPQIQDRFGLRVLVQGVSDLEERLEVYRRSMAYRKSPNSVMQEWATDMAIAAEEVQTAFDLLPEVTFAPDVERTALGWVQALQIESHRAEITLLEAGRAHAALDGRSEATVDDLKVVAPMALRQRQSSFMTQYIEAQTAEDEQIRAYVNES